MTLFPSVSKRSSVSAGAVSRYGLFVLLLCLACEGTAQTPSTPFRLDVRTKEFGNLFLAQDVIEVSCCLQGLSSRMDGLLFRVDVSDAERRVVRRFQRKADHFDAGRSESAVATFRLKKPGLYAVDAQAIYRGNPLASRRIWLGVVSTPAFRESIEQIPFGLVLTPELGLPASDVARQLDRLNVEWIKIPIRWHNLDYSILDPIVDHCYSRGLSMVGQLIGTARQASSTQDDSAAGEIGPRFASVPPTDYDLWEQFAKEIALRYKERLHHWEIWCDPQGGQGANWQGDAEQFALLVERAARGIRDADPSAKIINPGLFDQPDEFAKKVTAKTAGITDIVAFETDGLARNLPQKLQEKWSKVAAEVPIWVTDSRGGDAASVAQNYVQSRALGITRLFRYAYRDSELTRSSGNFASGDFVPTRSAIAYSGISNLLEESRYMGELDFPGETVCHVFEKDMQRFYVLWREDNSLFGGWRWPVGIHLGQWFPEAYDMFGNQTRLCLNWRGNTTLWIGEEPFIVTAPKNKRVYPVSAGRRTVRIPQTTGVVVIEAEQAFSGDPEWKVVAGTALSSGRAVLNQAVAETYEDAAAFEIAFNLERTGNYEICFAGTPLSRVPWESSAFEWQIDQEKPRAVMLPGIERRVYADGSAALTPLGSMSLGSGQHVFRITLIQSPTNGSAKHNLLIDCLILKPLP